MRIGRFFRARCRGPEPVATTTGCSSRLCTVFSVHNWPALPERVSNWNRAWKRFERAEQAGVFEIFFDQFAALSSSAPRRTRCVASS